MNTRRERLTRPTTRNTRFIAAFMLIGFTAVIAQVVLMRELIVVFHGNELALGIALASWFLWTALGSFIFGRVVARAGNSGVLMAALQGAISLALPLGILAARLSRSAFGLIPGELLGPGGMLLVSLTVLSLFCLLSGGLFAAGSRLYGALVPSTDAAASATLYLIEAVGSGAGGLLASLVLTRFLGAFEIAALLAALNLASASFIVFQSPAGRGAAAAIPLAVIAFAVLPSGARTLETRSLQPMWKGFRLLAVQNSIYGNLAVVATGEDRSLVENGLVVATAPDPAAAEESVHYALLEHPQPGRLLLIGGGVNGSLAQALLHPGISQIDYVELDPAIPELARRYFPEQWQAAAADPRVHVHYLDGRLFLKRAQPGYDVIIVNLPEPQTAQLNRFYTVEFFREVSRKLAHAGIFSFQLAGSENYISPAQAAFFRCINKTLREVFADVAVLPGDPVHFFAASQPGLLSVDPALLVERLRARQIRSSYVREYYIPFRLTPDRLADLESQIRPEPDTPVNRDLAPIAYYFDIALWSARFRTNQRSWFQSLADVRIGVVAVLTAAAMFVLAGAVSVFTRGARRRQAGAGFCVAILGFTLIALEMFLLLGFQALYGYVYHGLAILIGTFMLGMALGSWLALRRRSSSDDFPEDQEMRFLAWLQGAAALAPLALVSLFALLGSVEGSIGVALASQLVFPVLALGCGFLGGLQFPIASRVYFREARRTQANLGVLYALDLAGSCAGAIVLSVYFIPVFGFLKTALLLALANLAPCILMWTAKTPMHQEP